MTAAGIAIMVLLPKLTTAVPPPLVVVAAGEVRCYFVSTTSRMQGFSTWGL